MFAFFLNILRQKSGRYVCVQLLQTLNILFENISHETSLCKCVCVCVCVCVFVIFGFGKSTTGVVFWPCVVILEMYPIALLYKEIN